MPSPEFFRVQPVSDALKLLFEHWQPLPQTEKLDTYSAVKRIVAYNIHSPLHVPAFPKSTVDGYAVRASDTFGASQSLPAYLKIAGEVKMGQAPTVDVSEGTAVYIHTGGMLPDTADAVVMIEHTQKVDDSEIEVLKAAAPGENIIRIGEDVREGELILPENHLIRPQDIGGLLAVGITQIDVISRPRVSILSCGDELVPPEKTPLPGQIRDINAYMLRALVENAGGVPHLMGIAPDTPEEYKRHAEKAFAQGDMLVLTAGSSVSVRDFTRDVINHLGKPGVLQHGLATKPGKPTILAVCDGKPVIGLPGNPVSALLVARQILPELIAHAARQIVTKPATIPAILAINVASATGREDWIPVRLSHETDGRVIAEPIFGKSNLIYTLIQANGLIGIPMNSSGLKAGTIVEVIPF